MSEESQGDPRHGRRRAEEIYAKNVPKLEAGKLALDDLCAEHRDLADEIRAAHGRWRDAAGIYAALVLGALAFTGVLATLQGWVGF